MRHWVWTQQLCARGLETRPAERRQGLAGFQGTAPSHRSATSAAGVKGGGEAWTEGETTRRAKLTARTARGRVATHRHTQRPGTTGVEGAGGSGGPGRGAGGRWQGLAGLRDDAPSRRLAARTARGRAAAHRHTQRPGPTAGPDGARNTSGATQQQHGAWTASGRAGRAAAGDLSGEQATTAGFTRPRGGQPRA